MEKPEDIISPEDFANVVDVFRTLRKWRDENNQVILAEENPCEVTKQKEVQNEKSVSI